MNRSFPQHLPLVPLIFTFALPLLALLIDLVLVAGLAAGLTPTVPPVTLITYGLSGLLFYAPLRHLLARS